MRKETSFTEITRAGAMHVSSVLEAALAAALAMRGGATEAPTRSPTMSFAPTLSLSPSFAPTGVPLYVCVVLVVLPRRRGTC